MKIFFTFLTLLFSTIIFSQDLTGIWRGKFQQSNLDIANSRFMDETYKYEVQIDNLTTGGLEGVTYSYQSTRFYGKAALKGIVKSKTITIKETMMLEMKATGRTEPCLMTCYLDYKKNGNKESLSGTYTSVNVRTKEDCGAGTVYLERVKESDFEKESFLSEHKKLKTLMPKKKTEKKAVTPLVKNEIKPIVKPQFKKPVVPVTPKPTIVKKPNVKPIIEKPKSTVKQKPPVVKPIIKENLVKNEIKKIDSVIVKKEEPIVEKPKVKIIEKAKDEVLVERENKFVNTYIVNSKEVILAFYDNGEIDNDIISVYKDNKLVIDKKRLTTNPITLTLKFDDENTFYEIVTVAENLGEIPPNTALMVMNFGTKRKEVGLTTDEKTNAKFIVKYIP